MLRPRHLKYFPHRCQILPPIAPPPARSVPLFLCPPLMYDKGRQGRVCHFFGSLGLGSTLKADGPLFIEYSGTIFGTGRLGDAGRRAAIPSRRVSCQRERAET